MKKVIIIIALIMLVCGGCGFFILKSYLNKTILNPEITFVTLKYGTSSDKIIRQFNEIGFLHPNWFFKYYLRYQYKSRGKFIAAGTYQLPIEITNAELIEKLFSNDLLYKNKLTIPEGSNIYEVAKYFQRQLQIDSLKVIQLLENNEFCSKLNLNIENLEGYIMPETYFFEPNQSLEFIIKTLVKKQNEVLKTITETQKTNYSEYELLILASIIQAETSSIDEMPVVSSVYHNRLRIGMPLQADPTISYFIHPRKDIFKSDLKRINRFNTYLNRGLPPTPINSPSKEAIYAAANPARTNYIFFVAKSDTSRLHNFSSSYQEHKRNVKIYRSSANNK